MARSMSWGQPSATQCRLKSQLAGSSNREGTSFTRTRAVAGSGGETGSRSHRPPGWSTTAHPRSVIWSRRASAASKSLAPRQAARDRASSTTSGGAPLMTSLAAARPSGRRRLRCVAQSPGHGLQRLHRDRGMFQHQTAEDPLGETEQFHICGCRDGGSSRSAVEQRDLAEEFPGPERRLLTAADRNIAGALSDYEQADAGIALSRDDPALAMVDVFHSSSDRLQVLSRALRK